MYTIIIYFYFLKYMTFSEAAQPREMDTKKYPFQYDIIFLRHGDREGLKDALTEKGIQETRAYGQQVRFEKVAARRSDTERTKQTVDEIYSTAPEQARFNTRVKKVLHFKHYFSPVFLEQIRNLVRTGKREEGAMLQLNYDTVRPDSDTFSARETAAEVAKLLKHYLDMAKFFKPNTKLGILNVSHDATLIPLVAEVIRKIKEKEGIVVSMREAMTATGSSLKPLEEIRFRLVGDEKGKKLFMVFRGQEYPLDRTLVDEMSNYKIAKPSEIKQ